MSEAQRRATAAWRARKGLRRVEILVPADTLAALDARATAEGTSRGAWVLRALNAALGIETPAASHPGAGILDGRLAAVEAKLDTLLAVSSGSTPDHTAAQPSPVPADISTGSTPDHTKRDAPPDPRLVAIVNELRGNGSPWGPVADLCNKRGLLSPRGKPWTPTNLRLYCQRNGIDAGD